MLHFSVKCNHNLFGHIISNSKRINIRKLLLSLALVCLSMSAFAQEPAEAKTEVNQYGQKVYFLNIVMQYQYDDRTDYKRFRVSISRNGIESIKEMM